MSIAQLAIGALLFAAERSVSAAAGSCIDTDAPPMHRLQAKSVQGTLVDAVLWVEVKMASR